MDTYKGEIHDKEIKNSLTSDYCAFLLRIWRSRDGTGEKWLMSLEDPTNHQMLYFQTFDDLCSYLQDIKEKSEHRPIQQGIRS
ncbi:MAG TPA: hypothetical protein VIM80_02265 [Brevefilum sp.]